MYIEFSDGCQNGLQTINGQTASKKPLARLQWDVRLHNTCLWHKLSGTCFLLPWM